MDSAILEFFMAMIAKYPVAASVFMVVGVLRAVFKPLMLVAHAYVDATSNPKDNEMLAKAESSVAYKGLAFILDYLASIKLPQ